MSTKNRMTKISKVVIPKYMTIFADLKKRKVFPNHILDLGFEILSGIDRWKLAGKNPKGYTAAAIYLAYVQLKLKGRQTTIAEHLGVSEATIRARYKDLLKHKKKLMPPKRLQMSNIEKMIIFFRSHRKFVGFKEITEKTGLSRDQIRGALPGIKSRYEVVRKPNPIIGEKWLYQIRKY